MVTVYLAGGEDDLFFSPTGGVISTSGGDFRSSWARCAMDAGNNGYWRSIPPFSAPATTFWSSGWNRQTTAGGSATNGSILWGFMDASLINRLFILGAGAGNTFKLVKVNSVGTQTQLGSNFSMALSTGSLTKLDVYVDYQVAGTVQVYLSTATSGPILQFTYTGDVTTDGNTSLSYISFGSPNQSGVVGSWKWSEIMVLDTDTRTLNLQTLAAVANGNTHNFDTGSPAAANINEINMSFATIDGSTTAGQIDQYTIPSIVAGTFGIVAIGMTGRMMKGLTGPSKMDFGVRVSGTDYWSPDVTLSTAWDESFYWWVLDPNTSAVWTAYPTNIGLKSVT